MTQWRLTDHARDRLADRGITVEQLAEVLQRPSQNLPNPKRRQDGSRLYVGGGVVAVVNETTHEVITVGISGATGNDWVSFAPPAAAPLVESPLPVATGRVTRRSSPRRTAAVAEVASRNVLDDVHPQIAKTVRRLMRRHGLDYRAVRVCSPTDVRIAV